MFQKIAGGIAITLITAFGAAPAASAAPPTANDDWLPGITESAQLSTPVLVSGMFADPSGAPFPKGTPVEVVAYPSAEVVDAMVVGDSVEATPVAKGFVGADGGFAIRLPGGANLARFAATSGTVDLEIRSISGEYYAPYSFSATVDALDTAAQVPTGLTVAATQRTSGGVSPDLADVHVSSLPANEAIRGLGLAQAGAVNKTDVCGETLVSDLGAKLVVIGGSYTGGSGRTGALAYTTGASSTLGVGYSASGTYGTFSASGTISRAAQHTATWDPRTGNWLYKVYYNYGKYRQYCYPVYNPSAKTYFGYKVHADGQPGGSGSSATTMPSASHCTYLDNGSSWTVDYSTATTFSTGASLSGVIGINLSSRTGYSSATKVTYHNASGATKSFCGTNGLPELGPGLVVLK